MAYTATALAAALRGPTLTIGGRVYQARPLSAVVLGRVYAAAHGSDAEKIDATVALLQAAFPRRPRWRPWADPVRQVLALPADLQGLVLQRLVAVPAFEAAPARNDADDPVAATRRLHRALEAGYQAAARHRGATLEVAALHCEAMLGAAWYYAPHRWPTADGYAPAAVVLLTYHGLQAVWAHRRLEMAAATGVVQSGKTAAGTLRQWQRQAFPSTN